MQPKFLLLAVYSPSCSHCTPLLDNLQHAARQFQSIHNDDDMLFAPPLFAKLDATLLDPKLLEQHLGVTAFPTLLIITGTRDDAIIRDWFGSMETADQLYDTIQHYWYRWSSSSSSKAVLQVTNVHDFLANHGAKALQSIPPALDPNLSLQEISHLEWLLSDTRDFFIVFVQCGKTDELVVKEQEYHQAAQVMVAKRNVLFLQSPECTNIISNIENNGTIAAVLLDPPTDWNRWKDFIVQTTFYDDNTYDYLEQWIVQMTTPTILWYDYKSVAPIAFEKWRKIHAVLCVDVDDYTSTKVIIQQFYKACRHFRLSQNQDFVCLIVPQTERLIFNTLGIDIWSPLDFQATQGGPILPVLPTLVITDARYRTSTRRYYLDAADLLSSETSIYNFMDLFWKRQLVPLVKSSRGGGHVPRINESGVLVLTGATYYDTVVNQEEKHTLLYLFIPTCSHCKRFSILWNELSQLLQKMGWNSIIQIAKMDVTTNDVFDLDAREVPMVYFIPKSIAANPILYDVVDDFGDGPGRLSDSLEIVEWLLNVVAAEELIDPAELLLHLLQQEETNNPVQTPNGDTTTANNTKENENLKETNV